MMERLQYRGIIVLGVIPLVFMILLGAGLPLPAMAAAKQAITVKPKPTEKLPDMVVLTTLAVGTSKYVQSAGFREAVEKHTKMKVRLESSDTDLARVMPLQMNEAEFSYLTAVNAQMAAAGAEDYRALGPTPLRRVWTGYPFMGAMFARANAGFKTVADLRGKRIPQSKASVAWSMNNTAILAFGGLTLKDVKVVSVASIKAGMEGPLEGTLDASQGAMFNPSAVHLSSSRNGIMWFDMPASDTAGWKRLQGVTPWARPIITEAAGLAKGKTITSAGYEQGIWSTPAVPNAVVYAFAKGMKDGYDIYKGMEPELKNWTWQRAVSIEGLLDLPYHDGTVQFMKDMGAWTAAHEQFQQAALKSEAERLKK